MGEWDQKAKIIKYGLNICTSPIIKEEELYNIINIIIKRIISKDNIIIKEMLTLYNKESTSFSGCGTIVNNKFSGLYRKLFVLL